MENKTIKTKMVRNKMDSNKINKVKTKMDNNLVNNNKIISNNNKAHLKMLDNLKRAMAKAQRE